MTVVGNNLYAVGGFDDSLPLDSVEIYNPGGEWKFVASMTISRGGVGAASMGGHVWAVGGHNGSQYLNSVECYSPLTNQWQMVSSMGTPRAGAGVASCLCDVEIIRKAQDSLSVTHVKEEGEKEGEQEINGAPL